MRPDPYSTNVQLKQLIDDYISSGSRDIFDFFASLPRSERIHITLDLDVATKEIENSPYSLQNDCLIYARRLICGIQFKKMRINVDAAYSLERAGKVAYMFGFFEDCSEDSREWYRRSGELREAAYRLFNSEMRLVDAAHALGFGGLAFLNAGDISKAHNLTERTIKLFKELDRPLPPRLQKGIDYVLRKVERDN